MGRFARSMSLRVRSARLGSIQPRRADMSAAITMPAATASPCSQVPGAGGAGAQEWGEGAYRSERAAVRKAAQGVCALLLWRAAAAVLTPLTVAAACLNGVPKGVAQVERGAHAALLLVRRHHLRLVDA